MQSNITNILLLLIDYLMEDICFFEVNSNYISSSELKTSEFYEYAARVKILMFSTHEMIPILSSFDIHWFSL